MTTSADPTSPFAYDGSVPTWGPPPTKATSRVPWWPAFLAPFVGGGIAFLLFAFEEMWLLPALVGAPVVAFVASLFIRSDTARLVRRIAGGVLVGFALAFAAFVAILFMFLSALDPLFSETGSGTGSGTGSETWINPWYG